MEEKAGWVLLIRKLAEILRIKVLAHLICVLKMILF